MDGDFIALGGSPEPVDARTALNSKKRKFDQTQEVQVENAKATPWLACVGWTPEQSAIEQLQAEIDGFAQYIAPSPQEHSLRTSVVQDIRQAITDRYHDAQVEPFGSYQTRLYLPSADIDLVILSPSMATQNIKSLLFNIAALLKRLRLVEQTVVIWKAKVPIVKCTSNRGRFMIDISINQANGLSVGKIVSEKLDLVGRTAATNLIFLVKAFLAERGLNQVFSGGLSSYSVICLVISFLQLHPKLQQRRMDAAKNTAVLLIEFLELYGKHFNYDTTGVSINKQGGYYSKERRGWARERQPYLLSIEDPNDASNDIAGGTHNIINVRQSFSGCFDVLTQTLSARHQALRTANLPSTSGSVPSTSESLLGNIITLSEDLIELRKTNGMLPTDADPLSFATRQTTAPNHKHQQHQSDDSARQSRSQKRHTAFKQKEHARRAAGDKQQTGLGKGSKALAEQARLELAELKADQDAHSTKSTKNERRNAKSESRPARKVKAEVDEVQQIDSALFGGFGKKREAPKVKTESRADGESRQAFWQAKGGKGSQLDPIDLDDD